MADKFEIRVQDWERKVSVYNATTEHDLEKIVKREKASKWVAAIFVSKNGGTLKKVHSKRTKENPFLKNKKEFR